MAEYKVLYNPLSGNVKAETVKEELEKFLTGSELEFCDVTTAENYNVLIKGLKKEVKLVLVGGDGTLNRFINDVDCDSLNREVYYYAAGNGNDFWSDIGKKRGDAPVLINEYIKNLPTVEVNGKTYKFINGVGYGIDGYCCEVGDRLKAEGKEVNYTSIAIKGLLGGYKPCDATVTVDGVTKTYKKVWVAPTMIGRYYGGGMIPTPAQDRKNAEGKVSLCLFYGKGKIKTLMAFPKIFKGEHIKKKNMVQILSGYSITVKFAKPTAAQIDGETVLNVSEYTVTSAQAAAMEKAA